MTNRQRGTCLRGHLMYVNGEPTENVRINSRGEHQCRTCYQKQEEKRNTKFRRENAKRREKEIERKTVPVIRNADIEPEQMSDAERAALRERIMKTFTNPSPKVRWLERRYGVPREEPSSVKEHHHVS